MIDTAVILSARREKDSPIPYPLVCFDGSTNLFERTLSILKKLGIDKIILVAGYQKELFEKYEDDNLTIVYNPDYRYTGSMASLALAEPWINDDFLLLESDVLCEARIIGYLANTDLHNCLTIVNESGSGDEAFVEIDDDVVIKISKDRHQLNRIDGEMIGVSKISYDTFRRMMLRWKYNTNRLLNYEYLLLDATEKHERRYIKHSDAIWTDIDNADDLDLLVNEIYPKLRKRENPFDRNNIIDKLFDIFGDGIDYDKIGIQYIGGMTNRNFRVDIDDESYVLRIPGNGTATLIQRSNEGKNSLLSHRMGISPDILYIDEDSGIKLTRFIADAETLTKATIKRFDNLSQIADLLRLLHNSGVRLNNEFNVFHELSKYENILKSIRGVMYPGYEDVREEIMALEDVLNEIGVEIRPCHNDLVAENFIKDKNGRIFLIDWEYSGMNDPLWDLGALFLESAFDEDCQSYTLQQYFGHEHIDDEVWLKIKIYQILADTLWSLWTVIKECQGDDFGDYGAKRWSRALCNLRNLQNERIGRTN